jgi:hypothetical protein
MLIHQMTSLTTKLCARAEPKQNVNITKRLTAREMYLNQQIIIIIIKRRCNQNQKLGNVLFKSSKTRRKYTL